MTASHRLLRARHELQNYIADQAARIGVTTRYETDPRVLDISELLYYEVRDQREIRIFLDETISDMDYYVKESGTEDFPTKVLAIFVDGNSIQKDKLWDIYLEWMIMGRDVSALL